MLFRCKNFNIFIQFSFCNGQLYRFRKQFKTFDLTYVYGFHLWTCAYAYKCLYDCC